MDWLRQMAGLSEAWSGVIHDTASTATLTALLCARERTSGFGQNGKGLQSGEAPLTVYGSDQSHSSIEKAALASGFGRDHLRLLPTDENHALRLDALEAAIAEDLKGGLASLRARGLRRHHRKRRRWTRWRNCRTSRNATACGCMWTPPWPARRWFSPNAARISMAGAGRLARPQPAQMDGRRLRLQRLLRARSAASHPRHEHKPELSANEAGWRGEELPGLAYPARPALPRAQVLVLPSWTWAWRVQARLRRDLVNAQWLKEQVDASPRWERLRLCHSRRCASATFPSRSPATRTR